MKKLFKRFSAGLTMFIESVRMSVSNICHNRMRSFLTILGIMIGVTAVIALILGALVQTAAMVLMNMIFTPLFMGAPLETVLALMIPAIIPFNVLKAGINGVITFFLYKSISHLMKGN